MSASYLTGRPWPHLLAVAGLLLAATACDRDTPAESAAVEPAAARRPLPSYVLPPGVREDHPDVAAFLERFLETCLANDYRGYRQLVSRRVEPEPAKRFELIYHAIRDVAIESVEEVTHRHMPGPMYRVVARVELDPAREKVVRLRESSRRIAILVFDEDGELRMAPAPATMQPEDEPPEDAVPAAPTSQPASTQPTYPWEEGADG